MKTFSEKNWELILFGGFVLMLTFGILLAYWQPTIFWKDESKDLTTLLILGFLAVYTWFAGKALSFLEKH